MVKKIILSAMMAIFLATSAFCQDSQENEKKKIEFPQWALYVRRTEIVTLGSLPFTTLGVTMAFGAYQYFSGATKTFPNPFDKSSSTYSEDDVKKIIGISLSISALIGIVDLVITIVKDRNEAKRLDKLNTSSVITIVPATEEEIDEFNKSKSKIVDEDNLDNQGDNQDSTTEDLGDGE